MIRHVRYLAIASILVTLAVVIPAGCKTEKPPTPSGIDLSKTLVPNVDLDAYIYVKQDKPTRIPGKAIGASANANVESMALWGIAKEGGFAVAGALTFTSAADASKIRDQVPSQAGVWTAVSDRTVYFVRGSGPAEDSLKTPISKNDFKYYQDKDILAELALFPNGGNTKPAAVVIVKPNKSLVTLLANHTDRQTSDLMNALMSYAQVQSVIAALYAPAPIDVADLAQRLERGNIWESEVGVLASVKSGLPGALVGPIATTYLGNAGYTTTTVGALTLYKGSLNAGGKSIPVMLSVEGNRIYTTASGKESYARTLLTGIKR